VKAEKKALWPESHMMLKL